MWTRSRDHNTHAAVPTPNTALQFGRPSEIVWSNDDDESVFIVRGALIHSGILLAYCYHIVDLSLLSPSSYPHSFSVFLSLKVCHE